MSLDTLRLAVVYYPLTFLFIALLAGFTLRDFSGVVRSLAARLAHHHRVRQKRFLTFSNGACSRCCTGFAFLSVGAPCPQCGLPLVEQGAANHAFLRGGA